MPFLAGMYRVVLPQALLKPRAAVIYASKTVRASSFSDAFSRCANAMLEILCLALT